MITSLATLCLWLPLVTAAAANNFVSKHRVCDPTQNSWHPYTGVRIFNDVIYSSPIVVPDGDFSHVVEDPQFSASIVAIYCQDGEPTDAKKLWFVGWGNKEKIAGLASLSSMEAMWNREFCLLDFQSKETCYKVVRRRKYALRKLPLFRAGKIIGGLFQRHPEIESEHGMTDDGTHDFDVIEDPDKSPCGGCSKKGCSGTCKPKNKCNKCNRKGCSGKCKKKVPAPVEPADPCRGCGDKDCQSGECGTVPDSPCPGCNVPQCPGKCGKEPKQPCEGCNRKKCKGECGLIENPIEIISPYPLPTTTWQPDYETTAPPPVYSPAPGWPEVPQNETTSTAVDYVTVTTTVHPSSEPLSSSSLVSSYYSSLSSTSEVFEASSVSSTLEELPTTALPLDPRDGQKDGNFNDDDQYNDGYDDDYDDDHYDDGYDEPYYGGEPYDDEEDDYPPPSFEDDYDYDDDDYDDDYDDPYHDGDQDLDFDHAPPIPDYGPPPSLPDQDPVMFPKPCPDINCGHKSCQKSRRIEIDIRINKAKAGMSRRDLDEVTQEEHSPGLVSEDTNVESSQWTYPHPMDNPYDPAYPWPHPGYPMGPPVGHRRSRPRRASHKPRHKSYPCEDAGCDNERCLRARRAIEIEIIRAHNASVFSAASEPPKSTESEFVPQNLLDLFKHFHPPCCEMECGHDDCSRSRIELNIRIREQDDNITNDPLKSPCGIDHPPVEDLLPQNLTTLFKAFHPPCKGSHGCRGCKGADSGIQSSIFASAEFGYGHDTADGIAKRDVPLESEIVVEAQLLDWLRSPEKTSQKRPEVRGRQIRETIVRQQNEIAKKAGLMDLHDLFHKHKNYEEPCEEIDCGHDECDDMRRPPKKRPRPRPITRNNKGSSTIELDIRINENGTTVKRDLSSLSSPNSTLTNSSSIDGNSAKLQQVRRRPPVRDRYPIRNRYSNRGGYRRYGENGEPLPEKPQMPQHPIPDTPPPLKHQPHPQPLPMPLPHRPVDHPADPMPGYPGNPPPRYPAPPVRYHPPPPPSERYPYQQPPYDNGPYPLPPTGPIPAPSSEPTAPTEPCQNRNCGHQHCLTLRRGLSIDIRINKQNQTSANIAQFGPLPFPNFLPVLPLIADNIMNSWVRVARHRVHLMMPLVHSADVLDVQYPRKNDMGWATKLSVNENYDFNVEARNMAEVMFDNALAKSMDAHSNRTGELLGVASTNRTDSPIEPNMDKVLQDIQLLSPIDQMVALLTQFQREMAPPRGTSQLDEARAKYKAAKVRAKELANKLSY